MKQKSKKRDNQTGLKHGELKRYIDDVLSTMLEQNRFPDISEAKRIILNKCSEINQASIVTHYYRFKKEHGVNSGFVSKSSLASIYCARLLLQNGDYPTLKDFKIMCKKKYPAMSEGSIVRGYYLTKNSKES